jgi:hypothetical protein
MATFAYKGRNAQGALVQGVLEAPDTAAVASQLFSTGVTPVEIAEGAGPFQPPPGQPSGPAAVQPPDVHAAEGRGADHARTRRPAGIDR